MPWIYELWASFFVYAFLGWCGEVIFSAITRRVFVNCGVLSGPICPIYGVGAILVIACLSPLHAHPMRLFLSAVVLTSVLEFITGFLLERIFHTKWWDYTGKIGSIAGYVCLPMSLLWGAACLLVIYGIQPGFRWILSWLPLPAGWSALCLLTLILFIDIGVTTGNLIRLKKLMKLADDLKAAMLKVSDSLGEKLAQAVFHGLETKELGSEKLAEFKAKLNGRIKEKDLHTLEELRERYRLLHDKRKRSADRRLAAAFPRLKRHFLSQSVEQWLEHKKHHKGEDQ